MESVATPDNPVYSKFPQDPEGTVGTRFWGINVNEGWRSWILCTGMYEWAADGLLRRLRAVAPERWDHAPISQEDPSQRPHWADLLGPAEEQPGDEESRGCC